MYDLRHLIHTVETSIDAHSLGLPGAYCRWTRPGPDRVGEKTLSPYGSADAADLLYILNHFPGDSADRQAWVGTLHSLQNPESGLFESEVRKTGSLGPTVSHGQTGGLTGMRHTLETTAHCLAALELFDTRTRVPLNWLADLRRPHELSAFLDRLDWRGNPIREARRGAGLYAAQVLAGQVNLEWEERYFTFLWEESDPQSGLLRQGHLDPIPLDGVPSLLPHLIGTFFYLVTLEYAHRPLRYPDRLVSTCLDLAPLLDTGAAQDFSAGTAWVYCLNRAVRQSGHRFGEARQALTHFADTYVRFLLDLDPESEPVFDDLHQLLNILCCLAELQQALPGLIHTQRPLRQVLDRRPYL